MNQLIPILHELEVVSSRSQFYRVTPTGMDAIHSKNVYTRMLADFINTSNVGKIFSYDQLVKWTSSNPEFTNPSKGADLLIKFWISINYITSINNVLP